jgi:hypothetical protein
MQIGIVVYLGVFDAGARAYQYKQEQGCKKPHVHLCAADGGTNDLQRVEKEGHLTQYGYKYVFGFEKSFVGCGRSGPSAENEYKSEE